MIPLYTPAQVRAMDERTIAAGTPSLVLMERAAGHLARAVRARLDRTYGARVVVACGKGNNAGDGIAAARLLRARGADARIHLVTGEDGLSADAKVQLQRYRAAAGRELSSLILDGADVVVDCLLGTGSSGEPRSPLREAVLTINDYRSAKPNGVVVACDLPTGADAQTGQVADTVVVADATVSLGAAKIGLWTWPARGVSGELSCADIGLQPGDESPAAMVLEFSDVRRVLRPADPATDKRGRGVVVVLAASPGMSGAATMVARGALGMGVGLLTIATATAVRDVVAPTVPEALTVALPLENEAAFRTMAEQLENADVLAVGPGLGHDATTVELIRRLVREIDLPIVLDADGLNAFRDDGDALAERKSPHLVCTPHAREFARLLGRPVEEVWPDRLNTVAEAARRWRATIVAKGPGTLICSEDGRRWINATGSAALATGGTGDVLTGMIASALAAGGDAETVAAAVHIHGLAGEVAEQQLSPRSVAALDVAAAIPQALTRVAGR